MDANQALGLVRQNGVGKEIRCYFVSENKKKDQSNISIVNNYKFNENDSIVKIYLDQNSYEKHKNILSFEKDEKILPDKSSSCHLLIKKDADKKTLEVKLFCNFTETKNQFIYAKAYSVEYIDNDSEKQRFKI